MVELKTEKNIRGFIATGLLAMVVYGGCASMPTVSLPFQIKVVDSETEQPLKNASMKLVWRVGVGGITWGKPVELLSDSNGMITVTEDNIPAFAETGYPLRQPLRKIIIDRIFVDAAGCRPFSAWELSKVPSIIEMQRE